MRNVRTWAEIDLSNIISNYNNLKNYSKCKKVMAVVKADAYGHGAVEVTKALINEGCDFFAVATVDEAIQLRDASISSDILILGYVDTQDFEIAVSTKLDLSIWNTEYAEKLNSIGKILNKKINVHIKIDTGMTRFGYDYKIAPLEIEKISKMSNIIIRGLYTHFASADEACTEYTYKQFKRYMYVVEELEKLGITIPLKHTANSATTIMFKEMHLDIVRCGIALYGSYPSNEVSKNIELKPAMVIKSKIARLQNVEKGTSISYGQRFITNRDSYIATVPIGYADGFSRMLSDKAFVYINGEYAKVVGRICMDNCMIDVTDIEHNLKVEDEVEIFGRNISVESIAEAIGTINYEVFCGISKRVPRVYFLRGNRLL